MLPHGLSSARFFMLRIYTLYIYIANGLVQRAKIFD